MTETEARDGVLLRRFPSPYKAMLAISNDIDLTSIHRLRALFRFINTREETPLGPGLGLDFANSMWMYRSPNEMPRVGRRFAQEIAYWTDQEGQTRTPYADELATYARAGWIDTLHTYGNFTCASLVGRKFTRAHAEHAVEEMQRQGLVFPVWTNHGDRDNRQNIGAAAYMQGDDPASDAYHADLMRAAGVRFLHQAKLQATAGLATPTTETQLADGGFIHTFPRMTTLMDDEAAMRRALSFGGRAGRNISGRPYAQVWATRLLDAQLSQQTLDHITKAGLFLVIGQHLGDQATLLDLDPAAEAAFRRIADYQDRGLILTTRVSRLLRYAVNRENAIWRVLSTEDGPVIDVTALADKVDHHRMPKLEDLRGFSFDAPKGARIALGGRLIAASEIVRTPASGLPEGRETVSVRWHAVDTTDHSADFRRSNRYIDLSGFGIGYPERERLRALNGHALAWLEEAKTGRFKDANAAEAYALKYSLGRYEIGLEHYGELMGQLGFTGGLHGLDVGSGAGHWIHAFAALNDQATGIELREDFVEIANGVAAAAGLADRARSIVGDARNLPFEAETFDVVWSHGVIMFVEHDQALMEMSRVLKTSGALYIGYTSIGHRMRLLQRAIAGETTRNLMRTTINTLFNNSIYRAGIFQTPRGRVRCYTREELQHTARLAGFSIVAAPKLQDQSDQWHGREGTIDFLARKTAPQDQRIRDIVTAASDEAALLAETREAIRFGAPEAALLLLDEAKLDETQAEVRHARLSAMLKAGKLRPHTPAIGELDADETEAAALLRAKIALNFARWPEAIERLEALPATAETSLLLLAAHLYADNLDAALPLSTDARSRHGDDFSIGIAHLRTLDMAGDDARLFAETKRLLDDIADGVIDYD